MNNHERKLVNKALKGDSSAFGELVDLYWQQVYIFVLQKLGKNPETQDIVQETFTKAYHYLPQLRKADNFVAWLYQIASRLCTDYIRGKPNQTTSSLESIKEKYADIPTLQEKEKTEFLSHKLLSAVEKLPVKYKEVITLRFIGELSCKEISEQLGEPQGTIRNRLFRALRILKNRLNILSQENSNKDE
ncbi:MAG: sigma-70 family RNA polymerase sigma factor [Planctomycetota bacterium]